MNKQFKHMNWQVKVLDMENRIIEMIGSTEDYDRVGDRMIMSGGKLDNYLKNRVILANHDYGYNEKPTVIGKALDVRIEGSKLIFKIQFAETENAKDWFYLYANGYMNASSIGFIPIKYQGNDQGGYDFLEWELLELSLVAVPCNPNAVQRAYKEGKISKSFFGFIFKGAIPYKETPKAPEETEWDSDKNVSEADTDDLKIMCAWYDNGKPDIKESYKLPHHLVDKEHAVVWRGVAAAMEALCGAQDGVDIPEGDIQKVYDHLCEHYKQFGKEPPECKKLNEEEIDMKVEDVQALIEKAIADKVKTLTETNKKTAEDLAAKEKEIEGLKKQLEEAKKLKTTDPKTTKTKAGATLSQDTIDTLVAISESIHAAAESLEEFVEQATGRKIPETDPEEEDPEEEDPEEKDYTDEEIAKMVEENVNKLVKAYQK